MNLARGEHSPSWDSAARKREQLQRIHEKDPQLPMWAVAERLGMTAHWVEQNSRQLGLHWPTAHDYIPPCGGA